MIQIKSKVCIVCGKEKPLSDFYTSTVTTSGYRNSCKQCAKTYLTTNKEACKSQWCGSTLRKHKEKFIINITTNELYNYIKDKDHCEICGKELNFMYGSKGGKIQSNSPSLDRTNNEQELNIKNIQLLCNECNKTKGTKTMTEFILYCNMVSQKYGEHR